LNSFLASLTESFFVFLKKHRFLLISKELSMTLEFIGMLGTQSGSESQPPAGPIIDKTYIRAMAAAHELGGFDRVLIGYGSARADGFSVASYISDVTERLQILLAHRPGFVAPTLAARKLATLDHFNEGRTAVHIISGGNDAEQRRDGDYLSHDERYARTDEYLDVMKQVWTAKAPADYAGAFYKHEGIFSTVKPFHGGYLPIYFGGSSEAAIEVAAKHADVFALWGESLAQVKETLDKVRAAASRHHRAQPIRFSLSLRPVLAPTEVQAWERADRILSDAKVNFAKLGRPDQKTPENTGSKRLLDAAANGRVLDKRLWTEIAALTGAQGNSTGLVGTPEQVAESLLEYYDIGITTFLIRGFDPLDDAVAYGRELLPLVRQEVARRQASALAAE
jgi:alkanesulfonate monooxygenase